MSDPAIPSIAFPFERDRTYSFGELRVFERALSVACRADAALRKEWRVPNTAGMKEAVKVREETYPLMLLANAEGYPDSATFRLTPYGLPKFDALVETEADRFQLQITIADPIWALPDGRFSNGGYDERLVREALNMHGVVHEPIRTFDETFEACVRGIESALRKKIGSGTPEIRLLVHARDYRIHAIDFPFKRVVDRAFDLSGRAELEAAFGGYYLLDEGSGIFFEQFSLNPLKQSGVQGEH